MIVQILLPDRADQNDERIIGYCIALEMRSLASGSIWRARRSEVSRATAALALPEVATGVALHRGGGGCLKHAQSQRRGLGGVDIIQFGEMKLPREIEGLCGE